VSGKKVLRINLDATQRLFRINQCRAHHYPLTTHHSPLTTHYFRHDVTPSNRLTALARSFSLALLSWPQAAMMSRPRGVRTGLA